jgi:putative oxygen-independent coproporphyrinogen III oxidase
VRTISAYVHYPWCLKKCPYCDFLSVAAERESLDHHTYADAVIAELERRRELIGDAELRSIFFGGGTPSLWEPSELGRVLAAILAAFPNRGNASDPDTASRAPEITVECNPTSFSVERGNALFDAGVNRLSIGVQSLDAKRLEFLGRLHDPAGGLRAVEQALASNVPRVSADLIFGVVGQSAEDAAREAATVAALGVTHLSAYALTIEPNTEFGARARKGSLPLLPENDVAESFSAVSATLSGAGFDHYEISNFAREGHRAEHNLRYWRGEDYLGLGCGAWGTTHFTTHPTPPPDSEPSERTRVRYRNTPSPDRYLEARTRWGELARDGSAPKALVAEREVIDPETALRERLMLGLRIEEGVDLEASAAALGVEAWTPARRATVEKLVARSRLERDGSVLRIPRSAWLFADGTIAELM